MKNADTVVKKKINYSSCGDLLRRILARDGWTLVPSAGAVCNRDRANVAPDSIFLAQKNGRRIAFFFSDQPVRKLTMAFRTIQRRDRGQFKLIGVLIAPTTAEMQQLKSVDVAGRFPRAFFASLEEIRRIASGDVPAMPERSGGMASFQAEVIANTPIGGRQSSLYRLAFKAPALHDILPPQFIMMDATPTTESGFGSRAVRRSNLRGAIDLTPRPLLKRPFGVCRDFHPHFPADYVKHLSLPPSLALVLHPPPADYFDMLYKVLPDGMGTPLMTKLKRGQKIGMVGPLGRPFDVRQLRAEGVEEIHVIGGGVGMAPLILLVEALLYYAFPVKVFLGIAKLESLRYRDELAPTLRSGLTPTLRLRDAYVYIDDLLAAGVKAADIHVSCDSEVPTKIVRGIPKKNLFHGLVPEQYRKYLHDDPSPHSGDVYAFTCGPNRMMELVAEMAQQAGVRLQVLMEKRMACGMGVCFSCVQKVRRPNGAEDYARVCMEGPLFDAKDILWKNDDSKQISENSCCAAHC